MAARSDGGCWIAWFASVPSPTFYNMRIQRLDRTGAPQLGADGLLVSANTSASFTAGDWDLRVDSEGNALLSFNDLRGGADREISAYRIGADGTMLWGADGVQLSDDAVDEFDSRICQTTDGNFTVVFSRSNSGATPPRGLVMQRLDAGGNKLLAPEGVLIAGSGVGGAGPSDGPAFFHMVPSDNGSVICLFAKDARTATSARYPTIQKYGTDGTGLWNGGAAIQLQANAWPIGYYPNLVSDGAFGAVVSWHDSRVGTLSSWVQRVNAAGTVLFPAGGVAASIVNTGPTRLHVSPSVPVPGPAGETYVFWSERDSGQGTRDLHAQKIDSEGTRTWGDGGIALTPFDTDVEDFIRAAPAPCGPGAIVTYKQTSTGSTADTVRAIRVDGSGAQVWNAGAPVDVSTVASTKGRFPLASLADGSVALVWSDSRTDAGDIYAQKINHDGSLGGSVLCPGDFNRSGGVSVQDIFDFLAAYFSGDPCADVNKSGAVSVQDIFDFLSAYFAPCP
ncbi:MAG: hypothetical protein IT438_15220 [Phycisphaerales bacterium]|nr:hypothetical protein [Phycisphaerales bacterium]